jgi:CBS domain-containing protein
MFGVVDSRFLARSVGLLNPPPALTHDESDSIYDVITTLKNNRLGAVVVTDDEGTVSGIFTERDVVLKVSLEAIDIKNTPVSEVMTKEPKTEGMTISMAYALNLMSQGGYRHLPIVDDQGLPVSMISVKDIVDYMVREYTKELEGLTRSQA